MFGKTQNFSISAVANDFIPSHGQARRSAPYSESTSASARDGSEFACAIMATPL